MPFPARLISSHGRLLAMMLLPGAALAQGAAQWPAQGMGQGPSCVTARSQCPIRGNQPPGTQCACPDNPNLWGMVTITGAGQPYYPASPPPPRREELRNDDLDDDDDVLAGPRRHRRHAPADENP